MTEILAPIISAAFAAGGAVAIRVYWRDRALSSRIEREEIQTDLQTHMAEMEAKVARHMHLTGAFRLEVERITKELNAVAPVRTGVLRRSVGGPIQGSARIALEPDEQLVRLGSEREARPHDRRRDERIRAESCAQTEPFLGRTPAEAAENLRVKLGHCPHGLAEEVRLITGEVVAAVCPTCLEALPASFVGSAWKP